MKFPGRPKNWNDWLALLVIVGVPVMWVWASLEADVRGATIVGWASVLSFYFRKAPPEEPTA